MKVVSWNKTGLMLDKLRTRTNNVLSVRCSNSVSWTEQRVALSWTINKFSTITPKAFSMAKDGTSNDLLLKVLLETGPQKSSYESLTHSSWSQGIRHLSTALLLNVRLCFSPLYLWSISLCSFLFYLNKKMSCLPY